MTGIDRLHKDICLIRTSLYRRLRTINKWNLRNGEHGSTRCWVNLYAEIERRGVLITGISTYSIRRMEAMRSEGKSESLFTFFDSGSNDNIIIIGTPNLYLTPDLLG